MRLILKQHSVLMKCYWVSRKKRFIYGWFGGRSAERQFPLGTGEPTHIHFTYPEDGDLHFSFKHYDTSGKLHRVDHVYHDRRRIKEFPKEGSPPIRREERYSADLNQRPVMLPARHLPPLSEYAQQGHFFQFPVMALTLLNERMTIFPTDLVPTLRNDDVVVDVAACGSGVLNLFLHFYGRGYHPRANEAGHFVAVRRDTESWPTIELAAMLLPLPKDA